LKERRKYFQKIDKIFFKNSIFEGYKQFWINFEYWKKCYFVNCKQILKNVEKVFCLKFDKNKKVLILKILRKNLIINNFRKKLKTNWKKIESLQTCFENSYLNWEFMHRRWTAVCESHSAFSKYAFSKPEIQTGKAPFVGPLFNLP